MKRWKTSFTQSFQELKDLRNLAAVSMLLAITVVLGFYRWPDLRISFPIS